MAKRFSKCPVCESGDIEVSAVFGGLIGEEEAWGCWDCDWTEKLNEGEKDDRESLG